MYHQSLAISCLYFYICIYKPSIYTHLNKLIMKTTQLQRDLGKVLKNASKTTVIVTDEGTAEISPYFNIQFIPESKDFFSLILNKGTLMRFSCINFNEKAIYFIIFKDDAQELVEANPNKLKSEWQEKV